MAKFTSTKLSHPFEPFINETSEMLILGTFPSIKSIENDFYYSHPQNQFWKILAEVFNDKTPTTNDEKKAFLKKHKIALWDTVCKCERKENNSKDSNLKILKPCDIKALLQKYPKIKKIALTSKTAQKVFDKYFKDLNAIYLPSPSPLYASMKLNEKVKIWKKLLQ